MYALARTQWHGLDTLHLVRSIGKRLLDGPRSPASPDERRAGSRLETEERSASIRERSSRDEFLPLRTMGPLAIIPITGLMLKDVPDWALWFFEGLISDTRRVASAVAIAAADPAVQAIVLRIDSPGGSVDGLSELGDAIAAAAGQKRLIAQVDGTAASAAYYAASQAGEIRAGKMDVTGSIGVIWELYDYSALYAEQGIEAVPIATSEFKYAGMEGTELTSSQRAEFQRLVDQFFAQFKAAVQQGRRMSAMELAAVSDARVWLGIDALRLRLIDRISTIDETVSEVLRDSQDDGAGRMRMARARARVMID